MKVLYTFVSMVMAIQADYHTDIGISLAARIKAYEDKILAETPEMKSRVADSEIAPILGHPYMAGLIIRLKSKFISVCGSALVTDKRLVTAAHCITSATSLKAVFGSQYLFHGGTRIKTRHLVAHPKFNESISLNYDIGVVKLPIPVEISEIQHPIKLPTPEDAEFVGEEVLVIGWGLTKEEDRRKQKGEYMMLNQARLSIAPELQCMCVCSLLPPENFVCTSGAEGGATCDGDAGGPLIVERNKRRILIGVATRSHVPCEGFLPSAFTRILPYKDFILKSSLFSSVH